MEPSQWLMEHGVKNLFGEAATSARKHGFGEEQWEADHVSETATRAIMTVAVLIAGSGLMLHVGHAQQSGDEARLAEFPMITVRRVFHLHFLEIH